MKNYIPIKRKKWPDDYGSGDDHGIRCPKCQCARTKVVYTRHSTGSRNLRRRQCGNCSHIFTTYESTK